MDSYSVEAVLSARDAGFSSTFQKATGSLTSMLKGGVVFGAGMKAVSSAMGMVSSSMDGAISRFDTLNQFPKMMKNFGISADDSKKAIDRLSDGITGLPTTLDSAASGVQRFVSSNGDINKSTDYFLAMNDAIVAGGQSAGIQASAVEQLSQSYSKGKMDMIEWRSVMQAMPGQMNQIAKTMGMTTDELGEGLRTGKVSMDDFMDTIVKLDKEGGKGITAFKDQAKDATGGIQTAMTNVKTSVVRGLANMLTAIDTALEKNGMPKIGEMINLTGKKISKTFDQINGVISKIDFKGIVSAAKPYWDAFSSAVSSVWSWIRRFAGWAGKNAGTITKIGIPLMIAAGAFKGFLVISQFIAPLVKMGNVFSKLAGGLLARLAPQLFATGAAEAEAGAGAAAAAPAMLRMGAAVALIGAGIALACVGFALLAQSAIALAGAGGSAIAVMFGLVAGLTAMIAVVALVAPALTAGAIGMLAFGAAVLMVGAGVLVAALGIKILSACLPVLNTYGITSVMVLTQMSVAIAMLAASALMATVTLTAFGIACAIAAVAFVAASAAAVPLSAAMAVLGGALKIVAKQMKQISRSSAVAARNLLIILTATSVASAAMRGLANIAKTSMNQIGQCFQRGAQQALIYGRKMGTNFTNGLRSGMNAAKSVARSAVSSAASAMRGGYGKAYSAGANFGQGFANGLRSKLGSIRSIANQYVSETNRIIRAKARIGSPSKMMAKLGGWMGEGYANGLKDEIPAIRKISADMVNIPSVGGLSVAGYSGSFDEALSYSRNNSYTIEVPVQVDGRTIAKVSAPYTEDELSKRESRQNRRKGKR